MESVKHRLHMGQSYKFLGKGVSLHEVKATSALLKATLLSLENRQVLKMILPGYA